MTGEKCKCRPDILTEIGDTIIIADVKTCEKCKNRYVYEKGCRVRIRFAGVYVLRRSAQKH